METIYKEHIEEVHHKNSEWINQLSLYKEELTIFNERLQELAKINRDTEVLMGIEQYQNKFIVNRNTIDELEHDIHVIEDNAVFAGQNHMRRISYKRTAKYIYVKNSMEEFEKLFKELKNEFYEFLARNIF